MFVPATWSSKPCARCATAWSAWVIDDDEVGIVTQGDCAIKAAAAGARCEADAGGSSDREKPCDGQSGRSGRLHGNDGCRWFATCQCWMLARSWA